MSDIMKELTVGDLLALDESGETSFEVSQHPSGNTMIGIVRNGYAVTIMQSGKELLSEDGEQMTKDELLTRMRRSIARAKSSDLEGAVIGESKNTGAAEDPQS